MGVEKKKKKKVPENNFDMPGFSGRRRPSSAAHEVTNLHVQVHHKYWCRVEPDIFVDIYILFVDIVTFRPECSRQDIHVPLLDNLSFH